MTADLILGLLKVGTKHALDLSSNLFCQLDLRHRLPHQAVIALKRILLKDSAAGVSMDAIREIKILQELNHPNVMKVRNLLDFKFEFCSPHHESSFVRFEVGLRVTFLI